MSDPSQRLLGRRAFLQVAGAAGAAAGCSPKAATERLVPWMVAPEDIIPGRPLFYRTACRECSAGCGVTARTREGRATKLEGNPEDPIGRGALCARGQAAIQSLYHPERFKGPLRRGAGGALAPVSWDEAEDALAKAIAAARAKGPGRIRLLTRLEPGSTGAVQRTFMQAAGARPEDRVVLEPLDPAPLRAASEALLGVAELPVVDLSAARTVVAFGADLVETWRSPVELARQLADGRGRLGAERRRLAWVGPRLALTGVSADRWIACRSGGERAVALGVLRGLLDPASGIEVAEEVRPLAPLVLRHAPAELAARAGVAWPGIERLARELAARRPSALLAPGPQSQAPDATALAAVVLLVNLALGNVGRTVRYGLDPGADAPSSAAEVRALVSALGAGEVDVLLLQHADPLGTLPAALGVREALARVPLVVSFALRPDPSTGAAHLVLPDHHALEAFEDLVPRRGVVALVQPVMAPLADTRQASQVLMEVGAKLTPPAPFPSTDPFDVVQARAAEHARAALGAAPPDLAPVHRAALQRGGYWFEPKAAPAPALRAAAAAPYLDLPPAPAPGARALALVVFPTPLRGDGRGADLPWLREVPDALSSVSWSPWLELSPATARRLGVRTGDVVAVATAAGRVEVPAYVSPGVRDDAAGLPLGPEALALLPAGDGAHLVWAGAPVTVTSTGKRTRLPLLEGSPYQHGRQLVPTVTAAAPSPPRPDLSATMYPEPVHPEHRWAMAIDLDRCTGCQACVVACHAENNVPVMGPDAAREGRYMGWLKVERYLGDEPGGALDVRLLLMLCQHCTNGPCEPVCPVYATYHTAEGLNTQIYNRCVGTRYCSNNCPYKVRTFNWRDARFERPLDLQLNPDVTVRSRGVMEKCTFCIQRIRYAENEARDEGRPLADGDVVTACAQTCPTRAIVFGDAKDPASRVSRLSRDGRAFRALEEVNARPAIAYLARVKEREP
ncbi:molybdopterin dinucleotide binding domain-containing protein [Anaeromyxobacter oryzisoli]|uniref:molybdopterin dinucleotide binding domain-containing protein n=1 Tax=Anaeromyxobacter oryzisoli TaxID=2925408 RepID=UPI001F5A2A60|nr:molybdopterin dinucleotide binding domain-containing protein [Anaeromyxobacter sp. SG63]